MAERQDPKTLVNNVVVDAKALVKDNMALAKAELIPSAKNAGIGGGMFGAAGYLALNGVSLLFMAGGAGLGVLLAKQTEWGMTASVALGFVLMAVILFLLAGILALVGKSKIKKVGPPQQTIAEVKTSVASVKQSLTSGVNQVETDIRDRKGLVQVRRAAKDLDEL